MGPLTVSGIDVCILAHAAVEVVRCGRQVRDDLKSELGADGFNSWFRVLQLERIDGNPLIASLPMTFTRICLTNHFTPVLTKCSATVFASVEKVDMIAAPSNGAKEGMGRIIYLRPTHDAADLADRHRVLEACLLSACEGYGEMTDRLPPQITIDMIVELADHLGLIVPRATADMLRKIADVLECTNDTAYLRNQSALAASCNKLQSTFAACCHPIERKP